MGVEPDPRGRGPSSLVVIRHGESVGNLADLRAHELGAGRLELDVRDADVELSPTGREQAAAVGRFLARYAAEPPDAVLSSPYRRALATAEHALDEFGRSRPDRAGGKPAPRPLTDERLRERDLGVFDGLTSRGVREEYPGEARRRDHLGKFYYRPPGGESWCDVALRVRSWLRDVESRWPGGRVWVFSHRAVIMNLRLVLEGLDEPTVLRIDAEQPLANCAITTYTADGDRLRLRSYGDTAPVDGTAVTHEPESAGQLQDGARG